MKRKLLAALGAITILAISLIFTVAPEHHPAPATPPAADPSPVRTMEPLDTRTEPSDPETAEPVIAPLEVESPETLEFFAYVQHKFVRSPDKQSHLAAVRDYLLSRFDEDLARELYALYERCLECDLELMERFHTRPPGSTPDELLAYLHEIQEFRREFLGAGLADALYGQSVREAEYTIRRGAILEDDGLYGAEKQARLEALEAQSDLPAAPPVPHEAYQEKLALHRRDLAELSEPERRNLIKNLREECFPPETVQRLETVDACVREQQSRRDAYAEARRQLLADPALSPAERQHRLQRLRETTFGPEQARAVQKKETLRQATTDLRRRTKETR